MTKFKFNMTFIIPEKSKMYKGLFVSPFARKIALPKLYTIVAVIPAK